MITGKPFDVEIVTPDRHLYEGKADSLTVPGSQGQFQMLYNHAAIVAELSIGAIKLTDETGANKVFATSGGFVQMLRNKASIVVETAEESTSIDVQRAAEARKRAEERLAKRERFDAKRAEVSLARALNRLKIGGA